MRKVRDQLHYDSYTSQTLYRQITYAVVIINRKEGNSNNVNE